MKEVSHLNYTKKYLIMMAFKIIFDTENVFGFTIGEEMYLSSKVL